MAGALAEVDLYDAVWAKLDAITNLNTYPGEVPNTPPLDPDGRVHAYAVLYLSPGVRRAGALGGRQGQLLGTGQITCVGGDEKRALWSVARVRAGMAGLLTVGGASYRLWFREDDPGPVRRDDDVTPVRHYVPLEFSIFIP